MNTLNPSTIQMVAAVLFGLALVHTFSTSLFERLAHAQPKHAGIWHLLGEVEVVFGFWAMVLAVCLFALQGKEPALHYLETRNYTEPMFVFAIMVIAGTRPVLQFARSIVNLSSSALPLPKSVGYFWVVLAIVPLLGSLITEPAAMTLAALMLRDRYYQQGLSSRLQYATLGVLFVNISIGGTLTPYAAPPVLMVAAKWNWDLLYMLQHFGWKAALAVCVNATLLTALFVRELRQIPSEGQQQPASNVPFLMMGVHLLFLVGVVIFAHHPVIFMSLFLFFMGLATAYEEYQDRLILKEGLLVAFFLAGLVVLGGLQQWWLEPLLMRMDSTSVFFGATALTAITDNAALTYLGSLVEGLSEPFKYALVSGAVAGGGLTVIANAPNPAGMSILRGSFSEGAVGLGGLLVAALPPTLVAIAAFQLL